MNTLYVDADNLEEIREEMQNALDQAAELEPGCVTWRITYQGGQAGRMTRWPNDRGAVCKGGVSVWGDWITRDGREVLRSEEQADEGGWIGYEEDGEEIVLDR